MSSLPEKLGRGRRPCPQRAAANSQRSRLAAPNSSLESKRRTAPPGGAVRRQRKSTRWAFQPRICHSASRQGKKGGHEGEVAMGKAIIMGQPRSGQHGQPVQRWLPVGTSGPADSLGRWQKVTQIQTTCCAPAEGPWEEALPSRLAAVASSRAPQLSPPRF